MANIFTLENIEDFSEKLNIDELYEKKRQQDLNKLALFNKILNRIHIRIKTTSRQRVNENFCWFVVPEVIIGVPKYDQAACIAYLIDKLKTNGFNVRYIHPNTLFISWLHWVPSYVRTELKNKTGIVINEYGQKIIDTDEDDNTSRQIMDVRNPNDYMMNLKNQDQSKNGKQQQKKEYTPIRSYKPSGNLVYDDELLSKIEDKFI
uniref:Uncharacterized protein n=1 Tax=viral metagenome TaxID=1070528 RepID=A0A6C0EQZ8_9ZZZZ